jgi:hypothetical protein
MVCSTSHQASSGNFFRRILAVSLCLALVSTQVHASSGEAEADFVDGVTEACSESSGLQNAQAADLLQFDDTLNMVATLVTGVYPQPFMKGATGKVLCIYDKETGQTWLQEADGWSAPRTRQ